MVLADPHHGLAGWTDRQLSPCFSIAGVEEGQTGGSCCDREKEGGHKTETNKEFKCETIKK